MSDRRPKDLSSLKHLILDREYPLNTTRFLDELVKRKLITKIEEEELRKMKYRKQIDEIFVILYKKNPKPTFNAVKDIMNEMDRTDFVDGESSPNEEDEDSSSLQKRNGSDRQQQQGEFRSSEHEKTEEMLMKQLGETAVLQEKADRIEKKANDTHYMMQQVYKILSGKDGVIAILVVLLAISVAINYFR